jgi:hypothetical protein
MSQYTIQPEYYSRDPKLIGNDITLIPGDDIQVNNFGDIQLITNVDSIYKSIVRRIYTSKLDYERLFKTPDGLIITGELYGNDAFNYLSALNNDLNREYVRNEIERVVKDDPRIQLESIEILESTNNTIQIEVKYTILSNDRLATLVL